MQIRNGDLLRGEVVDQTPSVRAVAEDLARCSLLGTTRRLKRGVSALESVCLWGTSSTIGFLKPSIMQPWMTGVRRGDRGMETGRLTFMASLLAGL